MKDIISNDPIVQSIQSNNPLYQIEDNEFNISLLKYGSLVSILKNKRINQTMLMVELLSSNEHRDCFKHISGVDTTEMMLYNFIYRFPILCKSKIIRNKISEIHKRDKRKRKKIV
jgi:hypothetical protein